MGESRAQFWGWNTLKGEWEIESVLRLSNRPGSSRHDALSRILSCKEAESNTRHSPDRIWGLDGEDAKEEKDTTTLRLSRRMSLQGISNNNNVGY